MFQILLSPALAPFSLALALLLALFVLELIALMVGGSLFGAADSDLDLAPELAALDSSFDVDPGDIPDLAALTEASDALSVSAPAAPSPGVLGLGQAPFMVWFAAVLLGFGVVGFGVQSLTSSLLETTLPAWLAVGAAAVAGLGFARSFAGAFARLLPTVETSATSTQFMGGLRGVVSQGTARHGTPAEVRLRDRHGNLHYLRCEPLRADDVIPEGTDVLTLRERDGQGGWRLRILPVS